MVVEVGEPEALALLGELDAVLGKLSAADLSALSGEQLLGFTRELERVTRVGAVVQHAAVAELDSRHVAAEHGVATTATLLADLLRLDPGQARRRVRDARDFGPRRGLGGEPLPPIRPQTARALAGGDISIEHARAVADLFDHLPAQSEENEQVIEAAALDAAAVCGPHRLRQWCVLAASRIDPDGRRTERRDQTPRPRRQRDRSAGRVGEVDRAAHPARRRRAAERPRAAVRPGPGRGRHPRRARAPPPSAATTGWPRPASG